MCVIKLFALVLFILMAGLPRVTDIQTSSDKGVILVSWTAPKEPVRSYMIDWTHNGNQYEWAESKNTNATLLGRLRRKCKWMSDKV